MVKRLVTTMLVMASTNAGASTAQHSHSALGQLAAKALEEKAQSRGHRQHSSRGVSTRRPRKSPGMC